MLFIPLMFLHNISIYVDTIVRLYLWFLIANILTHKIAFWRFILDFTLNLKIILKEMIGNSVKFSVYPLYKPNFSNSWVFNLFSWLGEICLSLFFFLAESIILTEFAYERIAFYCFYYPLSINEEQFNV